MLQLWDDYDAEKTSENIRPDYLPRDQLYVSLEFNNGGRDLEKYEFKNATQALSAWVQVVHTLAVAESVLNFEHRDLHWGNILIKESEKKNVNFTLDGDSYTVETLGVETTIIDFSLSRLTSEADKCTIFNNLAADPTLFSAVGQDRDGDYQFDIYRKMRAENKNSWEEFNPKTNIFWLHYILEKMMTEVYYPGKLNCFISSKFPFSVNSYKPFHRLPLGKSIYVPIFVFHRFNVLIQIRIQRCTPEKFLWMV